jgi:hypothetical protein
VQRQRRQSSYWRIRHQRRSSAKNGPSMCPRLIRKPLHCMRPLLPPPPLGAPYCESSCPPRQHHHLSRRHLLSGDGSPTSPGSRRYTSTLDGCQSPQRITIRCGGTATPRGMTSFPRCPLFCFPLSSAQNPFPHWSWHRLHTHLKHTPWPQFIPPPRPHHHLQNHRCTLTWRPPPTLPLTSLSPMWFSILLP